MASDANDLCRVEGFFHLTGNTQVFEQFIQDAVLQNSCWSAASKYECNTTDSFCRPMLSFLFMEQDENIQDSTLEHKLWFGSTVFPQETATPFRNYFQKSFDFLLFGKVGKPIGVF